MTTEEKLPLACAFAVSVLKERDLDPDAVPEEAIEAAQYHMATCTYCTSASAAPDISAPRKKRKTRRAAKLEHENQTNQQTLLNETDQFFTGSEEATQQTTPSQAKTLVLTGVEGDPIDCQQCRQLLSEYAEAMDNGQDVAALYPDVQEHLLSCESGCLVLLELCKQEVKANRKYRRRPVRDPFSAIGWALSGFFRTGQVPMSPMALAYGVLILMVIVGSLSASIGINWYEAIYHPVNQAAFIPTPDGVGLSDGLHVYDACNQASYNDKRDAAQALQNHDLSQADRLFTSAMKAPLTDTTGCNGAEAAIYRENLHVRQSGRPFGIVVVSFDSGPGYANPQGGTDRHILYAPYTQELVGAFIGQQQYNATQMQTSGAPLLYLVLANTTGVETGALQVANTISSLARARDLQTFGLLASGSHPVLSVLGLGPDNLTQVALPVMCRAGIPLIAPTATGLFLVDLLSQTSLYRHCASGFAFIRSSPDDVHQSSFGASYAYKKLNVHNAAIFYDPGSPSSKGSAQGFIDSFSKFPKAHIVAQETAVATNLLDNNSRPQASRDDLLAGLNDALTTKPDLIFAPLLTNDVITLAQAISRLPRDQQPILMIGGEFVQPGALQGLVQWARQQQLSLPRVFVSLSSAARPPTEGDWQKQFYASFCTSFATPGSFCSGAAALDQGALLFADGIQMIVQGMGSITDASQFPTTAQLIQHISAEKFTGVSAPITLHLQDNVVVTNTMAQPMILGIQQDGSIQIVG